jgi:hypothetical protein
MVALFVVLLSVSDAKLPKRITVHGSDLVKTTGVRNAIHGWIALALMTFWEVITKNSFVKFVTPKFVTSSIYEFDRGVLFTEP